MAGEYATPARGGSTQLDAIPSTGSSFTGVRTPGHRPASVSAPFGSTTDRFETRKKHTHLASHENVAPEDKGAADAGLLDAHVAPRFNRLARPWLGGLGQDAGEGELGILELEQLQAEWRAREARHRGPGSYDVLRGVFSLTHSKAARSSAARKPSSLSKDTPSFLKVGGMEGTPGPGAYEAVPERGATRTPPPVKVGLVPGRDGLALQVGRDGRTFHTHLVNPGISPTMQQGQDWRELLPPATSSARGGSRGRSPATTPRHHTDRPAHASSPLRALPASAEAGPPPAPAQTSSSPIAPLPISPQEAPGRRRTPPEDGLAGVAAGPSAAGPSAAASARSPATEPPQQQAERGRAAAHSPRTPRAGAGGAAAGGRGAAAVERLVRTMEPRPMTIESVSKTSRHLNSGASTRAFVHLPSSLRDERDVEKRYFKSKSFKSMDLPVASKIRVKSMHTLPDVPFVLPASEASGSTSTAPSVPEDGPIPTVLDVPGPTPKAEPSLSHEHSRETSASGALNAVEVIKARQMAWRRKNLTGPDNYKGPKIRYDTLWQAPAW